MASAEELQEHFELLGVNVTDDILAKCIELCITYRIDAEELADTWLAFSLSSLKGAAPTVENLLLLESKKLSHQKIEEAHVQDALGSPHVFSGSNKPDASDLGGYCAVQTTNRSKVENHDILSSPTFGDDYLNFVSSPNACKSANYSSRENSGAVLLTYGPKVMENSWTSKGALDLAVDLFKSSDVPTLSSSTMFGYDLLSEKTVIIANHIDYLSQCILRKANITETVPINAKSQVPVTIIGRIACDAYGKLNKKSITLTGNPSGLRDCTVQVDLEQLKEYSVFPGQVVAISGINPRGTNFIAQEIFCDASLPVTKEVPLHSSNGLMQFVIASGPYTTSDCLSYEPLMDLAKYIAQKKPDIVVLTGPFLDMDHQNLNDVTMNEPYETFFNNLLDLFMSKIVEQSPVTKVVVVSSVKDIFHFNVYPTPPFNDIKKYPNLICAPDPSTLKINGVLIGVTSSDILMHLCKEEISSTTHSLSKMPRMASHLISQQCFYPLCPSNPEQPVDTALWNDYAHLIVTPHILILPSKLRYFVENINGCTIINPDRLVKGTGGGMFARLQIPTADTKDSTSSRLSCEIVRI